MSTAGNTRQAARAGTAPTQQAPGAPGQPPGAPAQAPGAPGQPPQGYPGQAQGVYGQPPGQVVMYMVYLLE